MAPVDLEGHSIVVVGVQEVGKTALILQLYMDTFVEDYEPTIRDEYSVIYGNHGETCKLRIIDTSGGNGHSDIRQTDIGDGCSFIIVYSICSRQSFEQVKYFYNEIVEHLRQGFTKSTADPESATIPASALRSPLVAIVGNKRDLESKRTVSKQEGRDLAERLGCTFDETSATDIKTVQKLFSGVCSRLREHMLRDVPLSEKPERMIGLSDDAKIMTPDTRWRRVDCSCFLLVLFSVAALCCLKPRYKQRRSLTC